MAVTQEQLDALDAAIAAGRTEISSGNKTVRYQSIDDMLSARAAMARLLRLQNNQSAGSARHQLADFSD